MGLRDFFFIHRRLGIKRRNIVVEVGSGGDPFPRSDILVEKHIEDEMERRSGLIFDPGGIAAGGRMLPFSDKSID